MRGSLLLLLMLCVMQPSSGNEGATALLEFRPPAVPLVACDPYFSVWSFSSHPGEDWTRHWTGKTQSICSFVRIDGIPFRLLGHAEGDVRPLTLLQTRVFPTRTLYEFAERGVAITMTFTTPALLHDLDLFAKPITYIAWQVRSTDGRDHAVSIAVDVSAELVVNTADQRVIWGRARMDSVEVLWLASQDQPVLEKTGDDLRIDWGTLYLAVPPVSGLTSVVGPAEAIRRSFVAGQRLPASDDTRMPRQANDSWPVAGMALDVGRVGRDPVERHVLLAYDDRFSIEYFHRKLRPYWRRHGAEASDLVISSLAGYAETIRRCAAFDTELEHDLRKAGGERYALLASLAYRQATAAHKLAVDIDGKALLFPKENFSNGCISTVDVIYPAAPIFLAFNPELLKASLVPVFDYAGLQRWPFPFAPHDLGTYPKANGQVYGGGETSEENQMPVEECGNMILLAAAVAEAEGEAAFAERYWGVLSRWADYLQRKGFDPENQLCTDDFAGHLAHNVNLSAKAILALGAYGRLCSMLGKNDEADRYRGDAEGFAAQWQKMADDGEHYRLAFDRPGTWSQKYNLVWDPILRLGLFPEKVVEEELRFYLTKQNHYGLPLDSRKTYTKLDWILWTATLAGSREMFERFVSPVFDFANESPSRVPLTDWYDTVTGQQVGFQARPVIGGVFIKLLREPSLWKKWRSRARGNAGP